MSKKRGRRSKKRQRPRALACPRCHSPAAGTPGALLAALATVMNACADAGMTVRPHHGVVETSEGYVLPLKGRRWTARTLAYDPVHSPPAPASAEED